MNIKKVGVLGGGQLGKMMAMAAANWHIPIYFLDPDENASSKFYCHGFKNGDFRNYEDVYSFGKDMDILTIEIEHVSISALKDLEKLGVKVFPQPHILEMIQDKGLQKEFFKKNGIPSPDFELVNDKKEILKQNFTFPFVQKTRKGGYDGKGVQIVKSKNDYAFLFESPSVIENCVDIDKELAIIGARNEVGEIVLYPPVEMIFNEDANLVEFLRCPAQISNSTIQEMKLIAQNILEITEICGLLAIEMFLDREGKIWVNEMAPRPHNSGHHTIESHITSQFEQHLRAILNFPLGSTKMKSPSIMMNILGEPGEEGEAELQGLEKVLREEGVYVHLYGKKMVKPFRKMGHVTILKENIEEALTVSQIVKNQLKMGSKVP
ncbi:MAG: hypothetical protein RJA52_1130 [Bacteroidota bacterium]